MAAVQAYACASGKGKKPSRRRSIPAEVSVAPADPQARPQLESRGVHRRRSRLAAGRAPSLRVVGSSSAAESTCALLECADRAQEVDLAERGPVDVCAI